MTTDAPKAGTPRPLESCTVDFDHVPADLQEAKEMLLRAKVDLAALREQLKECSAAFDRQQQQLDRNAEQNAALRDELAESNKNARGPKH